MTRRNAFTDPETLQSHLAAIVESSDDAILSKDLDGIIQSWNGGAERLYGYAAEEVVGRPVSILVPEDRPHELPRIMERLRRGERVDHFETVRLTKEGRRLHVSLTVSPIRDAQGTVVGASAVARDITDRRRMDEHLREANERANRNLEQLRAVIGQMTDGLVMADPDGNILSMNDAALAFHDLASNEEARNHLRSYEQVFELFDLETGAPLPFEKWPLSRALQGESFTIEDVRVSNRRTGREWIASYAGTPVRDADGRLQVAIITIRDVTPRRESEAALRRSEREKSMRADELAAVMESVPAVVWIAHDPDCHRITGSRAGAELLRMRPGSNLSQSAPEHERPKHFVSYHEGRRLAPDELPLQRAARGEHIRDFEEEVEFDDGTRQHLFGHAVPLLDEAGEPRGAVGAFVDITEQRRLMKELEALNEELEHRVAQRTLEAEKRTEQLRLMAAELTDAEQRERRRLAQLLHDDLQQILVAAHMRLTSGSGVAAEDLPLVANLVEQALDTSRSLSKELAPPVLYELGLRPALEWLVTWARERYSLEVEADVDEEVHVESEQLRVLLFQAIRELLLNVVKHAGVDRARLRVTQANDGNVVQALVEDSGVGLDPAAVARDPHEGGFGLFSLRERLELLDGELHVDSAAGEGTRIRLTVPVRPSPQGVIGDRPQSGVEVSKPGPSPAASLVRDSRSRVLLVDDHDVVRRGLAELIDEQPDMEVVAEAGSGEEAVELVRHHRPHVVMMDISLPGMSGIEATRRILADLPEVRIIGLSIHEASDVAEALRSAGAQAFLNKGEETEKVVRTIRQLAPTGS